MYSRYDVDKELQDLWALIRGLQSSSGGGGGGSGIIPWTADVLPAASPFTPTAAQVFVAVNTTTGPVTVNTPPNPFNGQEFVVKATAASATPITVHANGAGITVEDPSNGGTFGANGSIQAVAGGSARFKFRTSDLKWIAWASF